MEEYAYHMLFFILKFVGWVDQSRQILMIVLNELFGKIKTQEKNNSSTNNDYVGS